MALARCSERAEHWPSEVNDMMDELVLDSAALHPDRKKCGCGSWRALKRRAWSDISATTDGPKWIFLWQCACGSDAFDHVAGSHH